MLISTARSPWSSSPCCCCCCCCCCCGGARPVVDRLGTDRQDHDPARRRASGGRTWASEAGWSVIGVTATGDRVLFDGEPADGLSSAGRAPPGKARADDQTQPRASATVRWPATTASSAPPGSYPPRPAKLPDRRTPGRHHGMSGCRAAKSAGTWFPFPRRLDSGSGDRSSGWVRRGLPGAIPLVSWLTVGPGAGLGGAGIRRGVVAVRGPACTAEQCLQGQQDHASHRHPDTSSGQDVQGIVHP